MIVALFSGFASATVWTYPFHCWSSVRRFVRAVFRALMAPFVRVSVAPRTP
jgi:hypothetical protein